MTEQAVLFTESVLTQKGTEKLKNIYGISTFSIIQNIRSYFVIFKKCLDGRVLPL